MLVRTFALVALCGLAAFAARADVPPPSAPPPAAAPAPTLASAATLIDQPGLLARLEKKDGTLLVLDVRTPDEFAAGHVPGARNIAHDALAERVGELADARERDVVVYCRSGRRSQLALQTLRDAGFTRLLHLDGDFLAWQAASRPIEKSGVTPAETPAVR